MMTRLQRRLMMLPSVLARSKPVEHTRREVSQRRSGLACRQRAVGMLAANRPVSASTAYSPGTSSS